MKTGRRSAAVALAAAAAAHLPSLAGVFQFDDFNVIVNEPAAQSWSGYFSRLNAVRPALKASYVFCWTLGWGAFGFHAFNIAVHACNAALLYWIGRKLCSRWLDPSFAEGVAVSAALLFALHPAQTEAVTYISGRSVSLMSLFYLGSLLLYLRGAGRASSLALFALSLAVKETAVTLPAALLLCEACAPDRASWKSVFRRQAAHWSLLILGAAVVLLNPHYRALLGFGFTERGVFQNLLAQIGGVSYLLARLFTLHGFNIDPNLPAAAVWSGTLAVQAAVLAGLAAIGLRSLRSRPWLAFGVLWFFLQLAPTNSLVPRLDVANDRQLYLACWGIFLALGVELARAEPPPVPTRAALGLILTAFATASVFRQMDYASEIRLWESSLRFSPTNPRAFNNLGRAYQDAGRLDEARAAYRAAISLQPDYLRARVNLRLLDWSPVPQNPRKTGSDLRIYFARASRWNSAGSNAASSRRRLAPSKSSRGIPPPLTPAVPPAKLQG